MIIHFKRSLLACASLSCCVFGFSAHAQEQSEPAAENQRTLNAVTVTAQRREESIQDVPLSVTAADAETLAELRVENVENISLLTPSISFRKTTNPASSSNIQIRGIGTTGSARTFEGAVGVFIDGVYRTRSGQALSNFLDIDSLQVLRGPQGTLFGKNTSAGALLLTSQEPSTDVVEGFVDASIGNYNAQTLKGAINAPLADWAAVRVAAVHSERDGYFEDPNGGTLNSENRDAVKASLALEPSADLSVRVIIDYADQDDNCCYGTGNFRDGPLQGVIDSLTEANGLKLPSKNIGDREAINFPGMSNEVLDRGATILVDHQTDVGVLKSVTAFRDYAVTQYQDVDFSGADVMSVDKDRFRSDFFSQEFTFSGDVSRAFNADYVLGLYYADEKLRMGREIVHGQQGQAFWDVVLGASVPAGFADASPGLFSVERMESTSETFALFTHWDFELSDKWNLITGLRYTQDNKTGSFTPVFFRSNVDPLALAGVMPGLAYDEEFSDEAVTGTVSLQYSPNSDVMFYGSYNRGYKAGGVNLDVNAAGVPGNPGSPLYDPETVDAYEVGAKIDWLDGAARTNIAVFHNDITDLQVAQFLGLQFAIVNSPSAKVTGAEIEQTYAINDFLIANASATWLETANFGDDPVLGQVDPSAPWLTGLSGRRFGTAPELAGQVGLSLDYPMTGNLSLTGLAQAQYTGQVYSGNANNLQQDAVTLLNANIGLRFEEQNVSLSAFIRNATDEVYVTQHINTPLQGTDRSAYLGAPRTFGVALRKQF